MRRLGAGAVCFVLVLIGAPWRSDAAEPSVVFLSDAAVTVSVDQPVEIRLVNHTPDPVSTRVLLEPPGVATLTWGCDDTPLRDFASPGAATLPADAAAELETTMPVPLEPGAVGCVVLQVDTVDDKDVTAALTLVSSGGVQTRPVTVAAAAPEDPPTAPTTLSGDGGLMWDPGGGLTAPWKWSFFRATDVPLKVTGVILPEIDGTIGFVDGPDGLHTIEVSDGKVWVMGLREAGTYTGSIDLMPGEDDGAVEVTVDVGLQGGPLLAIALIALGIGLTSGLYFLATNRLPALLAKERVNWATALVRGTQARMRAAFDATVRDLDTDRWARWRLMPNLDDVVLDPASALAAVWITETQGGWTEDTVKKVNELAGKYQTTVNAGMRLLAIRHKYRAFPASPLMEEIDTALFGNLAGTDPVKALGDRCAALDTAGVRRLGALAEEFPTLESLVPGGGSPLRTKLEALREELQAADSADVEKVTIKRAEFESERAKSEGEPVQPVYNIELDRAGFTSLGDDTDVSEQVGLLEETKRLRALRRTLGIVVVVSALLIAGVLGFKENYLDNADTWGTVADLMSALTWTVAVSGAVNVARLLVPSNKLTEMLLK